jgi:predicted transcriptional regulator
MEVIILSIIKKLPDAEFEIMMIVWANEPPISTHIVMEQLGKEKVWKAQTIITLLTRLEKRGFIKREKKGKELAYYPIIKRDDYLMFESSDFLKRFHENSFVNLIATLYNGKQMNDNDLKELEKWLKDKKE